jgi:hypothetical protein
MGVPWHAFQSIADDRGVKRGPYTCLLLPTLTKTHLLRAVPCRVMLCHAVLCHAVLRPQGSKTPKFTRGFVLFLAFAICKVGAQAVSSSMDAVQPKIMLMILQQVGGQVGWAGRDGLVAPRACLLLTWTAVSFSRHPPSC